MKKRKRKGFTLVELLAVIVILAIVVGITLVTVLPALKDSRQKAFELSAQTAADYLEKQYQLSLIGQATLPLSDGTTGWDDKIESKNISTISTRYQISNIQLKTMGLKLENYIQAIWAINPSTGRACVKLYASTNETVELGILNLASENKAGEYYDAVSETNERPIRIKKTDGSTVFTTDYSLAESSGCS